MTRNDHQLLTVADPVEVTFKLREEGQLWEDSAPYAVLILNEDTAAQARMTAQLLAQVLANHTGQEVRYNWAGSYQGHYVRPVYADWIGLKREDDTDEG